MSVETASQIIERLVEGGLEEKYARIILSLCAQPPLKASEIGKLVSISRMDAYNSLKKLQEMGFVKATLDKPMRFTGIPVSDVFKQMIKREEANVRRLQQHLDELKSDSVIINSQLSQQTNEALFTVVKDRHNIYATIENIIQESEKEVWMMLSKWGILHLMRSGIISSITEALDRGIEIKIVADIESKTIRFFENLDKRIEIRHHINQSQMGVYVDGEVGVQIVHSEMNPTGRGKEDAALLVESKDYMKAQIELIRVNWNEGVAFESARARIVDGMITEPLKLKIGEGSFYNRLRGLIGNQEGFGFTNAVLRRPNEPLTLGISAASLSELGIDMGEILRSVGQRIGRELALELREEVEDKAFWNRLIDQWKTLGMGELEIDNIPPTLVTVKDSSSCENNPQLGSILCHMDEGVLEGILIERHGFDATASERLCTSKGQDHCLFEISIPLPE
jgi:sugar-specific transcriptional regulator TrmB/predicted hydrocarbon binding protein